MSPKSVQHFDMLYLASLGLYAVSFFLGYDDTVALTRAAYAKQGANIDPSMMIAGVFVAVLALYLLLWWLVSSKGNNIAKWVLTALSALGVVIAIYSLATGAGGPFTLALGLSLLSSALTWAAVAFLFQPDAKAWLERERPER